MGYSKAVSPSCRAFMGERDPFNFRGTRSVPLAPSPLESVDRSPLLGRGVWGRLRLHHQLKDLPGSAMGTPDPVVREEILGSGSFQMDSR